MKEKKYNEATFIGIALIIISIIVIIIVKNTDFTEVAFNKVRVIWAITGMIIRISCIFWIVSIAKDLKRDQVGWGFFAFFTPPLALIIMGQKTEKKPHTNFNAHEIETSTSSVINVDYEVNNKFDDQKSKLIELRERGILSDSEYLKKLNFILEKEEQFNFQKNNDQITKMVNERINPHLLKLSELTESNVFTPEEFEVKKQELFDKYLLKIKEEIALKQQPDKYSSEKINEEDLKGLKKIYVRDLMGVEIMEVTRIEQKLLESEIILKSKETKIIKKYSAMDIKNIIEKGEAEDYCLIEL
jgi:hypothetical protein